MNYCNKFTTKKLIPSVLRLILLNVINKTEPNAIKEHFVVKQSKINLRRNQFRRGFDKKSKMDLSFLTDYVNRFVLTK